MSLASGTVTASLTSGAGAGAGPGSDNTYGHAATTATASAFGFPDWRTMAEERDADEEDEATADRQLVNDRCCDLFLVDASESMRAVPAGLGRSPLQASLAAITVFMQAKIKQSDSDTISLVLFGTSTTRNELGCAGIHKLVDMDLPSIANIKRLEELSGDPAKLADAVGGPGECQFHQVFWLATNIFSRSAPRMARKRIFLITNNDDPTKGSQTALDSANTRIKDLENNHISIELFALNKTPTERFDFSLFYGKITEFWRDEDVEKSAMPLDGDYKALAERVQQKEFKKRVAFRVPFQISQTLQIGVKAFYLIMEKKAPDSTKVDIDGREVVTQSGLICSTTRELLGPKDLKYFYELGDARAIFTKDELDQIKTIGSPGLLLLGFKDIGDLKLKHNVRPSVFVVPDESLFEGSTSFFAHLHKRMCERKKMAICRLIARKTANPRMVALLPQAKGVDPTGREIPAGFNAIFLPFGDDLRKLSFVGDPVDAQNLDAATALIRAAAMNHFDFTVCHNPALQMLGKLIEAEAYGRDDVDFVDSTLPDEDAIRSRHGALIAAFNNICIGPNASGGAGGLARAGRRAAPVRPLPDSAGTDDADEDASQPMPRKRAARPSDSQESSGAGPSGAGPSGASRTGTTSKRSRGPVDLSVEGVRELSAKGNLGQLTIAQLTEFLQTVNWPIRGKRKPELIACVEQSTLQVSETDATSLRLRWDDPAAGAAASGESRFHFTWLRDNCQCPACVHPSNRQKLHSSADVAQGVRPAKVTVLDGGQAGAGAAGAAGAVSAEKPRLEIVWESGSLRGQPGAAHTSVFGLDWLRRYNYAAPPVPAVRPLLWDAETYAASRREHSYDAFISTREGLEGVLAELRDFGLCFLRGVPTNDRQVETVARRIGCIRETFYGTSWDVRSVPDAKNIAYTSLYLGLHMDLMYFEAPPGLQFLHSLQNTVTGGHSIFTDTHRAVEILKTEHPEHYKTLAKVPVTFHYINDGHHMHFSRPTITPGDVNDGLKVFYAPPFQGPLEAPPDVVDAFYAAFRVFEDILNRPELVYRTLLQPGDCVIFANRRVLHGRESFDAASGARHLKGTYVDWDDFKDKLRVHGLHQRR